MCDPGPSAGIQYDQRRPRSLACAESASPVSTRHVPPGASIFAHACMNPAMSATCSMTCRVMRMSNRISRTRSQDFHRRHFRRNGMLVPPALMGVTDVNPSRDKTHCSRQHHPAPFRASNFKQSHSSVPAQPPRPELEHAGNGCGVGNGVSDSCAPGMIAGPVPVAVGVSRGENTKSQPVQRRSGSTASQSGEDRWDTVRSEPQTGQATAGDAGLHQNRRHAKLSLPASSRRRIALPGATGLSVVVFGSSMCLSIPFLHPWLKSPERRLERGNPCIGLRIPT